MSRAFCRVAALAVVVLSAPSAFAQPGDPLELVRGLRENGMADLAIDYLDRIAADKPSPALAAVIPLERARARLDLAADETSDARRDAMIAKARAEFEQFLATQRNHPRRTEATIALARVVSAQAKSALTRANKLTDDAKRNAERAKARPVFQAAAKQFGTAAVAYAKSLDNPDLSPAEKKVVTRDVYQAELDRAINSYLLADTYDLSGSAKDKLDRGNALKQARDQFVALGKKDEKHPLCWVAKAWAAECLREMDSAVAAKKEFDAVEAAVKKTKAAAAGAHMANYFQARAEFLAAADAAGLRKALASLEQWLNAPANRTGRPSPEVYAARWYVAVIKHQQALALCDLKAKPPSVPQSAQRLLRQAERDLKMVASSENDYSTRAAERRIQVVRLLVGDAEKDPARIGTFDEAVMAAQVQLYRALNETEKPDDRTKLLAKAAALYERARQLPAAEDATREATDAAVNLVFVYRLAGRPHQSAILGEYLARTARPSDAAARAGLYAIQAYLQAAGSVDPTNTAARRTDQNRATQLALYLDKEYPADASTDSARAQVGQLLLQQDRAREAFELLSRVNPTSQSAAAARLFQGAAALELVRPIPEGMETADGKPALTPQQQAEYYRRAVADLSALPSPPPNAPADDARLGVLVMVLLAELHLTDEAAGYPKAEKAAEAAAKVAASFTEMPAEEKAELTLKAEHARLRALFAQAMPLYKSGKFAEAVAKVTPVLDAAAKSGPAAKDGQPEALAAIAKKVDEFRRDSLLVLAMQARIKEGAPEKVGALFDLMKKLGGSLDASVGAVGALVAAVKPQADALRKEGKVEEADKLLRGVGVVLDKVAAEPKLTPRVQLFLGSGLKDVGQHDKAIEVLAKIPEPSAEDLAKKTAELDDKTRLPVLLYREARLETARAHRLGGRFSDADKILTEALGTKEKHGWAYGDPNFRREVAYVLEDRASATADQKQSLALWGEASGKWGEMANDYSPTLRKLGAAQHNTKSAVLALSDLKALPSHQLLPKTTEEIKKGLAATKPPKWVTELLVETKPGPDGKPQPNPSAQEYVQTLKRTASRLEAQIKPRYHDLFFESIRCAVRANAHLLQGNPDQLQKKLASIAERVRDLESINPDLSREVKDKFAGLMLEYPVLKTEYDNIKVEPVAAAAPAEPKTDESAKQTETAATDPTKPADPTATVASSDEYGGTVGLVVGVIVGVLALVGTVVYFVKFRKPPPLRRTAYAPQFDDPE